MSNFPLTDWKCTTPVGTKRTGVRIVGNLNKNCVLCNLHTVLDFLLFLCVKQAGWLLEKSIVSPLPVPV